MSYHSSLKRAQQKQTSEHTSAHVYKQIINDCLYLFCRCRTDNKMSVPKELYEFLLEAELQHYYNSFKNELKVTSVPQIKYVEDEDLVDMGMSKPEIRRLKKFFKRECPQGAFGKIKKVSSFQENNFPYCSNT